MYLSRYFLPTLIDNPSDATMVSHRLMLRSGMIRQVSSGIYSFLPYGLKALNNIMDIIKKESDKVGLLELLTPTIQPKSLWEESGRAKSYGPELLTMQDRHGIDILYGPTSEEVFTDIFRSNVSSYKSLPMRLYQIQWKFRDEIRPRFGVMRGREFLMKDAYSFDVDAKMAMESYRLFFDLYLNIFNIIDIDIVVVKADNGEIGGSLSHEFHIPAVSGENEIIYDEEFPLKVKKGMTFDDLDDNYATLVENEYSVDSVRGADIGVKRSRSIEVAHTFNFGDKYSKVMKAKVSDKDGQGAFPQMGSYGIGITRLLAAIIEMNHDERGLVLPISIAPFDVIIVNLDVDNAELSNLAKDLYNSFRANEIEVLYDDTKMSVGKKMANADLIGVPYQIIVGKNNLVQGVVEVRTRKKGINSIELVKISNIKQFVNALIFEN